ncbi:uncharacterized protein MELLADRAFT_112804 [Melampsora larici-populina 98AG31]|uniref:Uncharacterized protein n=1 Tax=Melampsora larici-populina (strain 98AG31 / pathotype 3-4-7) TaxID=747676 RepID=F4S7P0_MELLP|nr:uncharacterized protein MELLADRAFT_112804 [Melampsora larici-populina 98AG31]EGF99360.1 hypothetical protein MELLADRAFT_112804 [Melampsora larici-populina 98AG31]
MARPNQQTTAQPSGYGNTIPTSYQNGVANTVPTSYQNGAANTIPTYQNELFSAAQQVSTSTLATGTGDTVMSTETRDPPLFKNHVPLHWSIYDDYIVSRQQEERVVTTTIDAVKQMSVSDLPPLHDPPLLEATEDLTNFPYLNELVARYTAARQIHTYLEIVLLAVTPFVAA